VPEVGVGWHFRHLSLRLLLSMSPTKVERETKVERVFLFKFFPARARLSVFDQY
jgi:hypothetical protein